MRSSLGKIWHASAFKSASVATNVSDRISTWH
jgi:hypothetical protein